MKNKHSQWLIAGAVQSATLASRFILMLFLTRELRIEDLGEYYLILCTVSYGIFLVGFDFYTFTHRQIIGASPDRYSDYPERDSVGRDVAVHVFGRFAIKFWDDFADRQVKILDVHPADRRGG